MFSGIDRRPLRGPTSDPALRRDVVGPAGEDRRKTGARDVDTRRARSNRVAAAVRLIVSKDRI